MIPFHKPTILGNELSHLKTEEDIFLDEAKHSQRCTEGIKEETKASYVELTFSGTTALEALFRSLNFTQGDEVILPSYSFASCLNAVLLAGLTPILADIDATKGTLNLESIQAVLSKKTKAILYLHYGGTVEDLSDIEAFCKEQNILLLEDAALSFGAANRSRPAGSFGAMSILSFGEKKPLHCGQGGALLVNKPEFLPQLLAYKNRGTNKAEFDAGSVPYYEWCGPGSFISLSSINTAFLMAQLEQRRNIIQLFRERYQIYQEGLRDLEARGNITLPKVPEGSTCNGGMFYFHVDSCNTRDNLIQYLHEKGIQAIFHYFPLHLSRGSEKLLLRGPFTNTTSFWERIIRLPLFYDLTLEQQERIIEAIYSFFADKSGRAKSN